MIGKYKGAYYKARMADDCVRLWAFTPVEGFVANEVGGGVCSYEKVVPLAEVDELFEAAFFVLWNSCWFACDYLPDSNQIRLYTRSARMIEWHPFQRGQCGDWWMCVDLDACTEFRVDYERFPSREVDGKWMGKQEWVEEWKALVTDLRPQNDA